MMCKIKGDHRRSDQEEGMRIKFKRSKTYGKKTRYKSPCDKGGKLQRLEVK